MGENKIMSRSLQFFSVTLIIVYYLTFFFLIKKKKVLLKYSLLWLFSGIVILIFAVFPELLAKITHFLGIEVSTNGLFGICIFIIVLILVFLTAVVSELSNKFKKIAQRFAIMEKGLKEIQSSYGEPIGKDNLSKEGCAKK